MFDRLLPRVAMMARAASFRTRDRILDRASLPADVHADPIEDGLLLTGRSLRRRRLTDARLRNFGQ